MAKKKTSMTATDAEKWLDKIDRAKKVRDDWRNLFRVSLAYSYWEGRQRPPHIPDSEWITINLIYSALMAELPTLYSTDPFFYVKLKKSYSINPVDIALFEAKAKIRQSMLNYLKGELNLKSKARLSIFDSYFQYGVCKVHYAADLMENPEAGQPIMSDESNLPLIDNEQAILQPDYLPANEAYCITRLHPDDFLVDEDAGPLDDDVNWKAQRIKRPLDEARKDDRYQKSARKALQATELKADAQKEREQRKKGGLATQGEDGNQPDTVVTWEVYDLKNKQWLTVAEGCKEFLIEPSPLPDGVERDPFVDLRLVLRDDSWYPIPPISQWIDAQKEFCELRSKMLTHRKRFNRKYTIYASAFDDPAVAMAKLESGEDGTVIEQTQPMQTVYPIADAPLDQQHNMEVSYLKQDFMDLVGAGSNQRGSSAGIDSATEAGIIEKRTQLREGDKIGLVMDFLTGIGRKLDQVVQANITEDQAIKVHGPGSQEAWMHIRSGDYEAISGEYEYSIATGSTTPQLPEIERAQWLAFLGLIAQNPQLALSKALLKKTAEMHHISPDDPMIEEVYQISAKMMSGQMPMPGQQGSMPNVSVMNPVAMTGGAAAGINNFRGGAQ
jgi:hypothetical protein